MRSRELGSRERLRKAHQAHLQPGLGSRIDNPGHIAGPSHSAVSLVALIHDGEAAIAAQDVHGQAVAYALPLETAGDVGDFMPHTGVAVQIHTADRAERVRPVGRAGAISQAAVSTRTARQARGSGSGPWR